MRVRTFSAWLAAVGIFGAAALAGAAAVCHTKAADACGGCCPAEETTCQHPCAQAPAHHNAPAPLVADVAPQFGPDRVPAVFGSPQLLAFSPQYSSLVVHADDPPGSDARYLLAAHLRL